MELTDPGPVIEKHERPFWKKVGWFDWIGLACPAVATVANLYYGDRQAATWAALCFILVLLLIKKQHDFNELRDLNKITAEQRNAAMALVPNPFKDVLDSFAKFVAENGEHQRVHLSPKKKETQH